VLVVAWAACAALGVLGFVVLYAALAIAVEEVRARIKGRFFRSDPYDWQSGRYWAEGASERDRMPKRAMIFIICVALVGSVAWAAWLLLVAVPAWTK
jgi:hypothetical protein